MGYQAHSSWSIFGKNKKCSCPVVIIHLTFYVHFHFLRSAYLYRRVMENKAQICSNEPHLTKLIGSRVHLVGKLVNCRENRKLRFNISSSLPAGLKTLSGCIWPLGRRLPMPELACNQRWLKKYTFPPSSLQPELKCNHSICWSFTSAATAVVWPFSSPFMQNWTNYAK